MYAPAPQVLPLPGAAAAAGAAADGPSLRWQAWKSTVDLAEDRTSDRRLQTLTYACAVALVVAVMLLVLCPSFVARARISRFEAPQPNLLRVLLWAVGAGLVVAVAPIAMRRQRAAAAAAAC
jgi:predicted membrane protein